MTDSLYFTEWCNDLAKTGIALAGNVQKRVYPDSTQSNTSCSNGGKVSAEDCVCSWMKKDVSQLEQVQGTVIGRSSTK